MAKDKQIQIDSIKYLQSVITKRLNDAEQLSDAVGLFSPNCVNMVDIDAMGKRLTTDDTVRLNLCFAAIVQGFNATHKALALTDTKR